MATAPKRATADTSDFSCALNATSCSGYTRIASWHREVRKGAATNKPKSTSWTRASDQRRQIVIEEVWVRVMQENGGTGYIISDHQWSSHDRARMKFSRHAITERVEMVDVNRPATANRFHRDGTFSGLQASSTKMLRH